MKILAKYKNPQTKTAGKIPLVPDTGPYSGYKLFVSPRGKTLEFSVGEFRGYYVASLGRLTWESTK